MIEKEIQKIVFETIKKLYTSVDIALEDIVIEEPKNLEFGDFATGIAFKLAKKLKKSPLTISEEIADFLSCPENWPGRDISEIGFNWTAGYINFKISNSYYIKGLQKILKEGVKYADGKKQNKKVQVEFISANPTGPLTLANGRGGFSGDVLARVLEKSGFEVEREYYVNDGGNQVKMLGDSVLIAAGLFKKTEDYYRGEYIDNWVKNHESEIDKLKDNSFELGQLAAKDVIEKYIKPETENMGIRFDNWFSELKLIESGEVEAALKQIQEMGLAKEEEAALWFKTTKFGDDKDRVLVKSDGSKTYFANDVAYHWDKFAKRKFDKVINFWGADHHGYIQRLQAAVTAMGFGGKLDIVIFQMVRLIKDGKEFRMSKRKGNAITMDDLLEMIGGSAKEASDVARFFFLSRAFSTQMDFDLDLAKEQSDKNPVFYVKYAYARISGILRNAKEIKLPKGFDLKDLKEKEEIALIKKLLELPKLVQNISLSKEYPVHELTYYVRDIASGFHSFYDKCRVIDESNLDVTAARLELVRATKIVLGIVMRDLIGIDTPEKM